MLDVYGNDCASAGCCRATETQVLQLVVYLTL